jgi:predicted nucleic acid-binding Zn ribbon protein
MRRPGARKSTEMPLKAAIEEFLSTYRLKDKLNEAKVIQAWEKVVGAMIAKHTERLQIRNRVLFVTVNSSVVRNELLYAKKKILASLNKVAGSNVVEDMVLS